MSLSHTINILLLGDLLIDNNCFKNNRLQQIKQIKLPQSSKHEVNTS